MNKFNEIILWIILKTLQLIIKNSLRAAKVLRVCPREICQLIRDPHRWSCCVSFNPFSDRQQASLQHESKVPVMAQLRTQHQKTLFNSQLCHLLQGWSKMLSIPLYIQQTKNKIRNSIRYRLWVLFILKCTTNIWYVVLSVLIGWGLQYIELKVVSL